VQLVSLAQTGQDISQDTLAHAGKVDTHYRSIFMDVSEQTISHSLFLVTSDLGSLQPPTMEGLDKKLVCADKSSVHLHQKILLQHHIVLP
jgi:hypothetical protein